MKVPSLKVSGPPFETYALDHVGGGFQRIATTASGNPAVMDLSLDREVGYLWAQCDDTCSLSACPHSF
jgi:hypothetical protein